MFFYGKIYFVLFYETMKLGKLIYSKFEINFNNKYWKMYIER